MKDVDLADLRLLLCFVSVVRKVMVPLGNVDERVPSFEEQITGVQHIGRTEMKSQVGV